MSGDPHINSGFGLGGGLAAATVPFGRAEALALEGVREPFFFYCHFSLGVGLVFAMVWRVITKQQKDGNRKEREERERAGSCNI